MSRRRPALSPRTVALAVLGGAAAVAVGIAIVSARVGLASDGADDAPALPPTLAESAPDASFSVEIPDDASPLPALLEGGAPVVPLRASRGERASRSPAAASDGTASFAVLAFTTTGESLKKGLKLSGARLPLAVVACDAPLDPGSLHVEGEERGVFVPRHGGPQPNGMLGRLEVEQPLARYASLVLRQLVIDTVELSDRTDRIRFTVDVPRLASRLGELRLQVADAQTGSLLQIGHGAGSANFVSVRLAGRDPWTGQSFTSPSELLPYGTLRFEHVPPGPVVLTLEAAGYERRVLEVDVPVGSGLDLGRLMLARWSTLTGRIADPFDRPGDVELSVFNAGPRSRLASGTPVCTGKSRDDGGFVLSALGREQYLLRARKWDESGLRVALLALDLRAGSVADLRVELSAARPVTFVLNSGLVSDLQLSREDGTILATWFAADRPAAYKTQLSPGRYRLAVAREGRVIDERTVEVTERTQVVSVGR